MASLHPSQDLRNPINPRALLFGVKIVSKEEFYHSRSNISVQLPTLHILTGPVKPLTGSQAASSRVLPQRFRLVCFKEGIPHLRAIT